MPFLICHNERVAGVKILNRLEYFQTDLKLVDSLSHVFAEIQGTLASASHSEVTPSVLQSVQSVRRSGFHHHEIMLFKS